jgi:uncharacterized protein (TIGR03083 family)
VGSPGDDHVDALLGAWALDACDPDEAVAVAAHLRTCAPCTAQASALRTAVAAFGAYATHPSHAGPPPRRSDVLAAARARRRPAPAVPEFAAPFAAATGLMESVLAEVDETVLALPTVVRDWSAGDLVAHVDATNGLLSAAVGVEPDPPVVPGQDVVDRSEALIAMARGWPPGRVRRHWRAGVDAVATRLLVRPDLAGRVVYVGEDHMSVANHLLVRAFETWIHARDIGGLGGVRVPPPAPRHLRPMVDLAAKVLDSLAPLGAGGPGPSGAVQLTLTGPGGGSWLVRVATDAAAPPAPDSEIIVDVVEFCLLIAERRPAAELDAVVAGDAALAAELLAVAPLLARA